MAAVLDTSLRVGYGWFKGINKRFGQTAYYMNGRALTTRLSDSL